MDRIEIGLTLKFKDSSGSQERSLCSNANTERSLESIANCAGIEVRRDRPVTVKKPFQECRNSQYKE